MEWSSSSRREKFGLSQFHLFTFAKPHGIPLDPTWFNNLLSTSPFFDGFQTWLATKCPNLTVVQRFYPRYSATPWPAEKCPGEAFLRPNQAHSNATQINTRGGNTTKRYWEHVVTWQLDTWRPKNCCCISIDQISSAQIHGSFGAKIY